MYSFFVAFLKPFLGVGESIISSHKVIHEIMRRHKQTDGVCNSVPQQNAHLGMTLHHAYFSVLVHKSLGKTRIALQTELFLFPLGTSQGIWRCKY